MTRTILNTYNGTTKRLDTRVSDEEALKKFLATAGENHWLWYHLHNHVNRELDKSPEVREAITFLGDLFLLATGTGLKNPMIRVKMQQRRFKIYLSQYNTICIKSGLVDEAGNPVGDEVYMGKLKFGKFQVATGWDPVMQRNDNIPIELDETQLEFVSRVTSGNVQEFLAQASKDMDRCCYCNNPLEDATSKTLGYGSTCAKHWGLPWGKKYVGPYAEKAPTFSDVYLMGPTLAGFMQAIRNNPYDAFNWQVMNDHLEDHGVMIKTKAPKSGARIAHS